MMIFRSLGDRFKVEPMTLLSKIHLPAFELVAEAVATQTRIASSVFFSGEWQR
jgi:hypothetical protein